MFPGFCPRAVPHRPALVLRSLVAVPPEPAAALQDPDAVLQEQAAVPQEQAAVLQELTVAHRG